MIASLIWLAGVDEQVDNTAELTFKHGNEGIDWTTLKSLLTEDDFDNGRTPEQLRISFENSHSVCFVTHGGRTIAKARLISDGVCNAYLVDVWTYTPYRRRGVASEMIRQLLERVPGQHVYLQADDDVITFYD